MAGIFEEVRMRESAYANNPQALQQRYAQSQQLIDLLALQQLNNEKQAAANQIQASMQTNPSTVRDQLEQEALMTSRNEIISELAPGIQQRGTQMQQAQGVAGMPAPNMMRAAQGGIVGYAEGGKTKQQDVPFLSPSSEEAQRQRYLKLKEIEAKFLAEGNQEGLRNIRRELMNYEGSTAAQAPAPTPENTAGMVGGGIVSLKEGGFPDLNKDGEVTQADILMGRGVVGKQEGGIVGYAPGGGPIGANNPFNIRDYNQDWQGQSGATRGFVDFEDEFSGVRAADKLLSNYGTQEGIDTLRGAISRFAPPNENLTEDYISFVSEQTGIPSEQPIDLGDERTRRSILSAMGRMESGKNIDVVGMLADDESRFGVTTDSGLSPEQARTQDETEEAIDAAFLRRTGRERPNTRIIPEGIARFFNKLANQKAIVGPAGYMITNPSILRSGEEIAETMQEYENLREDIKEDIPGLSLSDRVVLAGQELIGETQDSEPSLPQNEGITAAMYRGEPTNLEKLRSIMNQPRVGRESKEDSEQDIDFRALSEFLLGGAGQTTTAGALGGAGRRLNAYELAERRQAEALDAQALDRLLKQNIAQQDYTLAVAKLNADYTGKIDAAVLDIANDALGRLDLDPEYRAALDDLADAYDFGTAEYDVAKGVLLNNTIERYVNAAKESALSKGMVTGVAGDAGIVG